jgi:GT2 family glycosyltransferase
VQDLAIIVVSTNEAHWLRPCLRSIYEHAGAIELDVVVADNSSTDGTAELVEREFPSARVVGCVNHGFAHANNRALMTCDARYVLFLNPDTEIVEGTFEDLVRTVDERQEVGLAGVKQLTPDGALFPTIRRFPTALRTVAEALGSERLPPWLPSLGERELDLGAYERERQCDWTSGSFMLARREALESAGFMDERFFMYSEETDFCRRIKCAGWAVRHFPWMTILHYGAKAGVNPRIESMSARSRGIYAAKHFSALHRALYVAALCLGYVLRSVFARGELGKRRRAAHRAALTTMLRLSPPPHSPWSSFSVHPRQQSTPSPISTT